MRRKEFNTENCESARNKIRNKIKRNKEKGSPCSPLLG
jgi:hypothetical protein